MATRFSTMRSTEGTSTAATTGPPDTSVSMLWSAGDVAIVRRARSAMSTDGRGRRPRSAWLRSRRSASSRSSVRALLTSRPISSVVSSGDSPRS